ncbi:DNA polymerase epsilon catalytic subunit [Tulasnella sp. 331]|nr:DNA polymerase epsilon catalytic subunit [Tulasnella sp. 331]
MSATVCKDILPLVLKNSREMDAVDAYAEVQLMVASDFVFLLHRRLNLQYLDTGVRVGLWYTVTATEGAIIMELIKERVKRAEPVIVAYDIKVIKLPLKFPDQALDQIMIIFYMIDGQGFLIIMRDTAPEDIRDIEYTPKPKYKGPFTIFKGA